MPEENKQSSMSDVIEADIAREWCASKDTLSRFLRVVGLDGEEFTQALYIFPREIDLTVIARRPAKGLPQNSRNDDRR